MSKRDYYEILEVERRGLGWADQERLPQARAEVSPRPQSRGPRGRRALQGSGRGVRGARRQGEAALYDRFGHQGVSGAGGRRRVRPDHLRRLLGHLLGPRRRLRLRRHLRRPATPRRSPARLRSSLRPRDLLRGVRDRRRDDDPDPARRDVRDAARAREPRRHASRDVLAVPWRRPAALSAGLPYGCAAVLELPRHRKDDRQAVPGAAAAPDASAASAS